MPLNWISEQVDEVITEWDTNTNKWNSTSQKIYSIVHKVEDINENEKMITIDIPLLDWTIIPVTWTITEIILMRKELEMQWKIAFVSEHDDETARKLIDSKELTRWEYGLRWSSDVKDTVLEKQREEMEIEKRRKMMQDIKDSIIAGKAKIVYTTEQSKHALVEILIVSEEKIKSFFSKKNITKTWEVIWWIIEKWIYYAMPWLE